MTTDKRAYVPHLDGWRGCAILLVLLGHFGNQDMFSWMGGLGVQVFFVLSGYLMCHLLFIKRVQLSDFFVRRFTRVLPTFLLYLLLIYFYSAYLQPTPYVPSNEELLASLTFLRGYIPADLTIKTRDWAIGHLWSLNVEEHTYLFLAAVALITAKPKQSHVLLACLIVSTGVALLFTISYAMSPPQGASPWSVRTESASLAILAAATLRFWKSSYQVRFPRIAVQLVLLASLFLATLAFAKYAHKNVQYIAAPFFLAFAVNYLSDAPALLIRCLSSTWLVWVGKISFSLYLWQQPVYLEVLAGRLSPLAGTAIAFILGTLSFYLFEDSVRRRLNALWSGRKTASAQRKAMSTPSAPV